MKNFCIFELLFKRFHPNKIGVESELELKYDSTELELEWSFKKFEELELELELECDFQISPGVMWSWSAT